MYGENVAEDEGCCEDWLGGGVKGEGRAIIE